MAQLSDTDTTADLLVQEINETKMNSKLNRMNSENRGKVPNMRWWTSLRRKVEELPRTLTSNLARKNNQKESIEITMSGYKELLDLTSTDTFTSIYAQSTPSSSVNHFNIDDDILCFRADPQNQAKQTGKDKVSIEDLPVQESTFDLKRTSSQIIFDLPPLLKAEHSGSIILKVRELVETAELSSTFVGENRKELLQRLAAAETAEAIRERDNLIAKRKHAMNVKLKEILRKAEMNRADYNTIFTPIVRRDFGLTYYNFYSTLRNYDLNKDNLKMLTPCVKGQMQKAPKEIPSEVTRVHPVLDKVPSQECAKKFAKAEGYIFPTTETAAILDQEESHTHEKTKNVIGLQKNNMFLFEIHPWYVVEKNPKIFPELESEPEQIPGKIEFEQVSPPSSVHVPIIKSSEKIITPPTIPETRKPKYLPCRRTYQSEGDDVIPCRRPVEETVKENQFLRIFQPKVDKVCPKTGRPCECIVEIPKTEERITKEKLTGPTEPAEKEDTLLARTVRKCQGIFKRPIEEGAKTVELGEPNETPEKGDTIFIKPEGPTNSILEEPTADLLKPNETQPKVDTIYAKPGRPCEKSICKEPSSSKGGTKGEFGGPRQTAETSDKICPKSEKPCEYIFRRPTVEGINKLKLTAPLEEPTPKPLMHPRDECHKAKPYWTLLKSVKQSTTKSKSQDRLYLFKKQTTPTILKSRLRLSPAEENTKSATATAFKTCLSKFEDEDFVLTLNFRATFHDILVTFSGLEFQLILTQKLSLQKSCCRDDDSTLVNRLFFENLYERLRRNGDFLRKVRKVLVHPTPELLGVGENRRLALSFIIDLMNSFISFDKVYVMDAVKIHLMEAKYRHLCAKDANIEDTKPQAESEFVFGFESTKVNKEIQYSSIGTRNAHNETEIDCVCKSTEAQIKVFGHEIGVQIYGKVHNRKNLAKRRKRTYLTSIKLTQTSYRDIFTHFNSCTCMRKSSSSIATLQNILKVRKSFISPSACSKQNIRKSVCFENGSGDSQCDKSQDGLKDSSELENLFKSCEYFVPPPTYHCSYTCNEITIRHPPILWVLARKLIHVPKNRNSRGTRTISKRKRKVRVRNKGNRAKFSESTTSNANKEIVQKKTEQYLVAKLPNATCMCKIDEDHQKSEHINTDDQLNKEEVRDKQSFCPPRNSLPNDASEHKIAQLFPSSKNVKCLCKIDDERQESENPAEDQISEGRNENSPLYYHSRDCPLLGLPTHHKIEQTFLASQNAKSIWTTDEERQKSEPIQSEDPSNMRSNRDSHSYYNSGKTLGHDQSAPHRTEETVEHSLNSKKCKCKTDEEHRKSELMKSEDPLNRRVNRDSHSYYHSGKTQSQPRSAQQKTEQTFESSQNAKSKNQTNEQRQKSEQMKSADPFSRRTNRDSQSYYHSGKSLAHPRSEQQRTKQTLETSQNSKCNCKIDNECRKSQQMKSGHYLSSRTNRDSPSYYPSGKSLAHPRSAQKRTEQTIVNLPPKVKCMCKTCKIDADRQKFKSEHQLSRRTNRESPIPLQSIKFPSSYRSAQQTEPMFETKQCLCKIDEESRQSGESPCPCDHKSRKTSTCCSKPRPVKRRKSSTCYVSKCSSSRKRNRKNHGKRSEVTIYDCKENNICKEESSDEAHWETSEESRESIKAPSEPNLIESRVSSNELRKTLSCSSICPGNQDNQTHKTDSASSSEMRNTKEYVDNALHESHSTSSSQSQDQRSNHIKTYKDCKQYPPRKVVYVHEICKPPITTKDECTSTPETKWNSEDRRLSEKDETREISTFRTKEEPQRRSTTESKSCCTRRQPPQHRDTNEKKQSKCCASKRGSNRDSIDNIAICITRETQTISYDRSRSKGSSRNEQLEKSECIKSQCNEEDDINQNSDPSGTLCKCTNCGRITRNHNIDTIEPEEKESVHEIHSTDHDLYHTHTIETMAVNQNHPMTSISVLTDPASFKNQESATSSWINNQIKTLLSSKPSSTKSSWIKKTLNAFRPPNTRRTEIATPGVAQDNLISNEMFFNALFKYSQEMGGLQEPNKALKPSQETLIACHPPIEVKNVGTQSEYFEKLLRAETVDAAVGIKLEHVDETASCNISLKQGETEDKVNQRVLRSIETIQEKRIGNEESSRKQQKQSTFLFQPAEQIRDPSTDAQFSKPHLNVFICNTKCTNRNMKTESAFSLSEANDKSWENELVLKLHSLTKNSIVNNGSHGLKGLDFQTNNADKDCQADYTAEVIIDEKNPYGRNKHKFENDLGDASNTNKGHANVKESKEVNSQCRCSNIEIVSKDGRADSMENGKYIKKLSFQESFVGEQQHDSDDSQKIFTTCPKKSSLKQDKGQQNSIIQLTTRSIQFCGNSEEDESQWLQRDCKDCNLIATLPNETPCTIPDFVKSSKKSNKQCCKTSSKNCCFVKKNSRNCNNKNVHMKDQYPATSDKYCKDNNAEMRTKEAVDSKTSNNDNCRSACCSRKQTIESKQCCTKLRDLPDCCWPKLPDTFSSPAILQQMNEESSHIVLAGCSMCSTKKNYVFGDCCNEKIIAEFKKLGMAKFKETYPPCCWPKLVEKTKNKKGNKIIFNDCCGADIVKAYKKLGPLKFQQQYNKCCQPHENNSKNANEQNTRFSEDPSAHNRVKAGQKGIYSFPKCCNSELKREFEKIGYEEFMKVYPKCCHPTKSVKKKSSCMTCTRCRKRKHQKKFMWAFKKCCDQGIQDKYHEMGETEFKKVFPKCCLPEKKLLSSEDSTQYWKDMVEFSKRHPSILDKLPVCCTEHLNQMRDQDLTKENVMCSPSKQCKNPSMEMISVVGCVSLSKRSELSSPLKTKSPVDTPNDQRNSQGLVQDKFSSQSAVCKPLADIGQMSISKPIMVESITRPENLQSSNLQPVEFFEETRRIPSTSYGESNLSRKSVLNQRYDILQIQSNSKLNDDDRNALQQNLHQSKDVEDISSSHQHKSREKRKMKHFQGYKRKTSARGFKHLCQYAMHFEKEGHEHKGKTKVGFNKVLRKVFQRERRPPQEIPPSHLPSSNAEKSPHNQPCLCTGERTSTCHCKKMNNTADNEEVVNYSFVDNSKIYASNSGAATYQSTNAQTKFDPQHLVLTDYSTLFEFETPADRTEWQKKLDCKITLNGTEDNPKFKHITYHSETSEAIKLSTIMEHTEQDLEYDHRNERMEDVSHRQDGDESIPIDLTDIINICKRMRKQNPNIRQDELKHILRDGFSDKESCSNTYNLECETKSKESIQNCPLDNTYNRRNIISRALSAFNKKVKTSIGRGKHKSQSGANQSFDASSVRSLQSEVTQTTKTMAMEKSCEQQDVGIGVNEDIQVGEVRCVARGHPYSNFEENSQRTINSAISSLRSHDDNSECYPNLLSLNTTTSPDETESFKTNTEYSRLSSPATKPRKTKNMIDLEKPELEKCAYVGFIGIPVPKYTITANDNGRKSENAEFQKNIEIGHDRVRRENCLRRRLALTELTKELSSRAHVDRITDKSDIYRKFNSNKMKRQSAHVQLNSESQTFESTQTETRSSKKSVNSETYIECNEKEDEITESGQKSVAIEREHKLRKLDVKRTPNNREAIVAESKTARAHFDTPHDAVRLRLNLEKLDVLETTESSSNEGDKFSSKTYELKEGKLLNTYDNQYHDEVNDIVSPWKIRTSFADNEREYVINMHDYDLSNTNFMEK